MARSLSVAVALLGVGASAAIVLWPKGEPDRPVCNELAAGIDARLNEVAAGVHARVTTLADLPRLMAAVSTDAATVENLTQNELAFRPKADETIEIGQIPKGGAATTLLRIPAGGAAAKLAEPGVHLGVAGDRLLLSEVVSVRPSDRADELLGAVAVSSVVALPTVGARLQELGWGAQLVIGDSVVALGSGQIAAGDKTTTVPLASKAGQGARLVIAPHAAGSDRAPLAAGALALLSLIGAALLWRRPAALAPPPVVAVASASANPRSTSGIGTAGTELAVGTGRQIGRYLVLRPLGAGGMAEVFLAQARGEAGFEKLVALKVLHKHVASDSMIVDHFLDEARLASRLTHPNIVQITDLGRAEDEYFIAMEYVDGTDLEKLLQGCRERGVRVPTGIALTILRKICDGLHAAHSATSPEGVALDLVHRDVKSANVFVARNGAVKVGDFGIAKTSSVGRVAKTEIGQVKGTAAYMAPEHRTGEAVDRRADIYAVGAIAFELLSGTEINLDLALLAHKGRDGWPHLPQLSALHPDLPPELDAVVTKALAYDREGRYATCDALEVELETIAAKYGLVASDKAVAQFVETALAAGSAKAARVTAS